jgi:hypothetical protein
MSDLRVRSGGGSNTEPALRQVSGRMVTLSIWYCVPRSSTRHHVGTISGSNLDGGALLTCTVATDWQGVATSIHVVELPTPFALRRHIPSLTGQSSNLI